jgi:MoaA/NifB/PqqE/SkfB family radical SAM enzyme
MNKLLHVAKAGLTAMRIRRGRRIPLKVTHCVTWNCNLSCLYCARHSRGDELDTVSVTRMMDLFATSGTLFWSFNGGEPLIRKDLGELAAWAKGLGMQVTLNSNGTLLAQRQDVLKHVDLVNVSVEGTKAVHDLVRDQSHDRMVAGLETLASHGVPTTLTTVVNARNADGLDEVLRLAEAFGARVFFQPVRVQKEDREAKSGTLFPDVRTMRQTMDYLLAQKKKGRPVASSKAYLRDIAAHWPNRMTPVPCVAGRAYCFVTPLGQVTACCDTLALADPSPAANLLHSGLAAFQNIPKYRCKTCFPAIPLETNILFNRSLLDCGLHGLDIIANLLPKRPNMNVSSNPDHGTTP